jgi:hypothetical protein
VTRKAERQPVRKVRERAEAGRGAVPRVRRAAYQEAARAAFEGEMAPMPWETQSLDRQRRTRALYLAQARVLAMSSAPRDRELARQVEAFVTTMPAPDSQRLALARELREANRGARDGPAPPERQR